MSHALSSLPLWRRQSLRCATGREGQHWQREEGEGLGVKSPLLDAQLVMPRRTIVPLTQAASSREAGGFSGVAFSRVAPACSRPEEVKEGAVGIPGTQVTTSSPTQTQDNSALGGKGTGEKAVR